ncbi:SRPBCC family protein [Halobium salinum]|uniref:SRPBCC family protein n=1 Tax=Halobium salinum TaxID=1364940 RepID=A0ABD5PFV4_9EURY|nr:SRPBCC family protein [Halobium salinum]
MANYHRQVRVAAPLDEVWAFHSRIEGLTELTPEWMNMRVEGVRGPDGDPDPEVLEAGSQARLSVRPLGIGPRQRWTSKIVYRDEDEESAVFRDTMEDGPFREWVHTHRFVAAGGDTIVHDDVEYRLPLDGLGDLASPFAVVGFEPMFRYRHRKTKEHFEGGGRG